MFANSDPNAKREEVSEMTEPSKDHQNTIGTFRLDPDAWTIRILRYSLALAFLALAIVKLGGFEVATPLLEPLKLQFAAVWAAALFQFFVAALLLFHITYALAASFILVYGTVLTWMHFNATGSLPMTALILMFVALILVWSDFKRDR